MHPRIREINDSLQTSLDDVAEAQQQVEFERQQHYTGLYGKRLGKAAARFASLGWLDSDREAAARQYFANEVTTVMAYQSDHMAEHPINAVIEATEFRTNLNLPSEQSLNLVRKLMPATDAELQEIKKGDF